MKMQYSLIIYFYYAKINRDRTKKPLLFRIKNQQILKYIITSCFKKTSNRYKIYYSCHFYKCFHRIINGNIFIPTTCKDQYKYTLKIKKIDKNS